MPSKINRESKGIKKEGKKAENQKFNQADQRENC